MTAIDTQQSQRGGGREDASSLHALLLLIAEPRIGRRPGRIEPRVRNRCPKQYPFMTELRAAVREDVRLNGHPKNAALNTVEKRRPRL